MRRTRAGTATTVGLIATNPVAVRGTQVTLSLAEAVLGTDTVTVAYTEPGSGGRLRDNDKRRHPVKSFAARSVTNNTPSASVGSPPQFSSAAVNGKSLEVTFNETLQTALSHRPPHSAFAVSAMPLYGTARTISGATTGDVAISGSTVSVTLDGEVERGETVAVSYTQPTTKWLQGTNGFHANSFSGQPATNNTAGAPAPTFSSASYSYRGGGITVHFTGPFLGCAAAAAWSIMVDGTKRYPQVVRCGDRSVLLVLAALTTRPAVEAARAVTVSYNRSTAEAEERSTPIGRQGPSTKLTGTDGSAVESFTDKPVTGLKPRLVPPPTVDGSTLTLTFDEEMDPGATPGNVLFDVTVNGDERYLARSGGVAIAGKTVRLTLSSAVGAGDTVTVRYTKPRGCGGHCSHGLRGASHIAVDTFPDQAVTNNSAGPVFASAVVVGSTLTVTFDKNLDTGSKPSPAAFRVTANNNRLAVASGGVAIAGKTVKLTLFRSASAGDTVKVSYTRPSANPLRGTNGIAVDTFAEQTVANNPAETIWSATLSSGSSRGTFTGCSDASSSTTERCSARLTANSFTSGDTTYQVERVESIVLVNGNVILVFGLDRLIDSSWTLHVGSHRLSVADASLSDGGKTATWTTSNTLYVAGQQVSLRLTEGSGGGSGLSAPVEEQVPATSVTGVSVVSDPGADQTYGIGDTISVQVTFNQLVVDVDTSGGTPRIKIDLDPAEWGEKWASYSSGSGTANLTFTHTVVEPNISTQGIAVLADTLELNGGTIRSDGADAGLAHTGLAHDANHKVDWQTQSDTAGGAGGSDAEPASVTGVSVVSDAGADKTYGDGDTIQVRVTFDETVDVTGSPRLKIDMDPAEWGEKWASYASGSGTTSLTFAHTVVEPNISTQGIAVLANTLEFNSGTIRAGGADADLAHDGRAHDANHKVNWQTQSDTGAGGTGGTSGPSAASEPPSVSGVAVTSNAGDDNTYRRSDVIRVTVTFDEKVDVTGSPRLKIDMDPAEWGEKWASYESGSGTTSLSFAHTVVEPNYSTQGIAVLANTLELNSGTIRSASGTDADLAHDGLAHDSSHKVDWRPGLSVADARAEEGAGAAVEFAVRLGLAATQTVTVNYATADGTALAGQDYTAASGTLTFAAGESSKTVSVAVLDDAHDEGEETFTLRLSNASGAWLEDAEATGTIENTDLMPAALLARFGRATAEQVVDQVEERMGASREGGFRARLAGREYQPGMEGDFARGFLSSFAPMGTGAHAAAGAGLGAAPAAGSHLAGAFGADTSGTGGMAATGGATDVTGRQQPGASGGGGLFGALAPGGDLLSSSGFELNRASHGGMLSLWSRTSRSYFAGMEEALSLNGDVRTTMFGADWARGPLTVGLSVGHTRGLGGYAGASGGAMTTAMTGFYPWVGYQVNDRVSVWAVTGYGKGSLTLTPDGAGELETGTSMAMTAVGTRGDLLGSRATGGFGLAFKADALWVGASTELLDGPTGRLNASEAGATRMRTALEGSRGFTLGGDRLSLRPTVEVGLRRDGGDAETGAGLDVGGGLAVTDAALGLSLDVRVRTLLVHQAEGFAERGLSVSFGWDPTPSSPFGLSARLAPSWGGSAMGGAEALWNGQMAYGPGSPAALGSGAQLAAEVGYGLPVGARFVGTPRVGLRRSAYGREYRAGWGLGVLDTSVLHFDLGLEAQRREAPTHGGAGNGLLARATVSW